MIGPFRTSPLGLVPKPHSNSHRLVQDMSYPRSSSSTPSVNSFICSDDFPTEWGTIAATAALILSLPPGCTAATFDISAAYRITPVRPSQQQFCCVGWKGKVYVDRAVCFGCRSSAGVFGSIADMLVAIYRSSGFGPLTKWVDDFFVIWLPHHTHSEEEFMEVTAALGVPWSLPKLRRRALIQRFIGFDWDLPACSVIFPADKLSSLLALLASWQVPAFRASMSEASHLHGKLVHASSIFLLIRPFLVSISRFASSFRSSRAKLHLPAALCTDLCWVSDLLHRLPNKLPLSHSSPFDVGWFGDASTSFGIGVVIGPFWCAWHWSPGFTVGPKQSYDIGWAEAAAVELGLHLFIISTSILRVPPHTARFLVRSDNAGIVSVVNKGRSRSRNTNTVLKSIYSMLADLGISLQAEHVRSEDNISDPLSRGDIPSFLSHFPHATHHVPVPLPSHLSGCLTPL